MPFNLFPNFIPDESLFVAICSSRPNSRQLHPKNRLDEISISLAPEPGVYLYPALSVSITRTCLPSRFCTCAFIIPSFLVRTNSCISASHTSGSHFWRDWQPTPVWRVSSRKNKVSFHNWKLSIINQCKYASFRCEILFEWHRTYISRSNFSGAESGREMYAAGSSFFP